MTVGEEAEMALLGVKRMNGMFKAFGPALTAALMTACGGGANSMAGAPHAALGAVVVVLAPDATGVATLQSKTFQASVANDQSGQGVTWHLSGAGCSNASCGNLANATSTSVEYAAPTTVPTPPFVTLTATSLADPSKSDSANITLYYPGQISVTVSPLLVSIKTHETTVFTAVVSNDPADAGVAWTIEPACDPVFCGRVSPTITASGVPALYEAPGIVLGNTSLTRTLRATSRTDAAASATATVRVTCSVPSECIP